MAPSPLGSADGDTPAPAADTMFPSLSTAAGDSAPTEIESLCMNCHKQGTTRLLLTSIPFFKDVVLMSFSCPHCHYRSSEVQPGGEIAAKGITLTLTASQASDLQRSVLLSDAATVSVAELDLTVPPASRGRLTTVEGILGDVAEGLTFHQAERREADPDQAAAVDAFLGRLAAARVGVDPFTLTVRDPSGNSHIEAELPGRRDPRLRVTYFERTLDESLSLGLNPANIPGAVDGHAEAAEVPPAAARLPSVAEEGEATEADGEDATAADGVDVAEAGGVDAAEAGGVEATEAGGVDATEAGGADATAADAATDAATDAPPATNGSDAPPPTSGSVAAPATNGSDAAPVTNGSATSGGTAAAAAVAAAAAAASAPEFANDEVLVFREACPACGAPGENRMKVTTIPHFKEVVIMAFVCAHCGYKSSEVKPGGGVEPRGTRTTLMITRRADLSRDVLKSEAATVEVPELELELAPGTLGGRFTTVEGLLVTIKEQLISSNPFAVGDSASAATRSAFTLWLGRLDDMLASERPSFSLCLDDPTGNSYVQNVYAPDADPQLTVTSYERTAEQDDELGISHLRLQDAAATSVVTS
ncbi:hypothetical protein MMPV_007667 [Pyropia vietnamensis]